MATRKNNTVVAQETATAAPKAIAARRPSVPKRAESKASPPASSAPVQAQPAAEAPLAEVKAQKSESSGKKPKLVRDSFTLPEADYALFKELKARCLKAGVEVKKTELLRVALRMLADAKDEQLLEAVRGVERIKAGRPANKK